MNTKAFFSKLILQSLKPELAKKTGRCLYSPADSLKKGEIYILGVNPGGDPECECLHGRIRDNIFPLENKSAYVDESWPNKEKRKPGKHPLQERVKFLVRELGPNINRVCASNLIFVRSQSEANLAVTADSCWPAHKVILNIVKPRAIIVYGNSPFFYLKEKVREEKVEDFKWLKDFQSGHGNWKCRAFRGTLIGRQVTVIGLPHLSRFKIDKDDHPGRSPIINWIKKQMV